MKNVLTITDPGLDPDDIVCAWLLTKLRAHGLVNLIGFIANYSPSLQRARLLKRVLISLGAGDVPVVKGTDCNSNHEVRAYEFDFKVGGASNYEVNQSLERASYVRSLLEEQPERSVTLLLISGLTDIHNLITECPELLKSKLKEVYIMGGGSWGDDGTFLADPTASNNKFDRLLDCQAVYDWFIDQGIPLHVLTRHAAYAASVTPDFYDRLATVNTVGAHLAKIQQSSIASLWQFANSNPPEHRQNRGWFIKTFTDEEELPITAEQSPWDYIKRLSLYDPLTVMWMVYPEFFKPSLSEKDDVQIVGLSREESGIPEPGLLMKCLEGLLTN